VKIHRIKYYIELSFVIPAYDVPLHVWVISTLPLVLVKLGRNSRQELFFSDFKLNCAELLTLQSVLTFHFTLERRKLHVATRGCVGVKGRTIAEKSGKGPFSLPCWQITNHI